MVRKSAINLIAGVRRHKALIIILSVLIVMLTTYILVLPALTLDEEEAEKKGGISLASQEESPVLDAEGKNYRVEVAYKKDAEVPAGAELSVERVTEDSEGYDYNGYIQKAKKLLEADDISPHKIRLFDIAITDEQGEKVEIQAPVSVDMTVENFDGIRDDAGLKVIHFAGKNEKAEIVEKVEVDEKGSRVAFKADGFSVYALVEVPDPWDLDGKAFHMSVMNGNNSYYFMGEISDGNKIRKTAANAVSDAVLWHFEKADDQGGLYYIFMEEGGSRTYMCMDDGGNMSLSDDGGTAFNVDFFNNTTTERFYIYKQVGDRRYGLNMFGGVNGRGFAGWTGKDNGSSIALTRDNTDVENDPLGLDGKSYALFNYKTGVRGIAMLSDPINDNTRLAAETTLLRDDPLSGNQFFIARDSDAALWTFTNISEDKYYITTEVDGVTKYMSVTPSAVRLLDEPDADSVLTVTAGMRNWKGKIRITGPSGYSPNLYGGKASDGYGSWNDGGENEWLNLASKTDIEEEDFVAYKAHKVSVSDRVNVPDGAQVVIYTRVWNDSTKEYEFYAVDHQGHLARAYEAGDTIEWIGLQVNNMLWDFTEYKDPATGEPNFFYELQNHYSEKYMAPQIGSSDLLSDSTIGVNLNGRRYGHYYTQIIAWDDDNYRYAGYKIENGKLVTCPLAEADDFYFAIMKPVHDEDEPDQEDELTTVKTVDNNDYGISMNMVDYYNSANNDRQPKYNSLLTSVIGGADNVDRAGLVTSYLGEDGYPKATITGTSLKELFTKQDLSSDPMAVNHLFLASTYRESGYFEFDSTQNFAHLNEDGNFTVYDQLATIDTENKSLDHGQFMPYNDIVPGEISNRYVNNTNELDQKLSDNDPRLGEQLYSIPYNQNKAPNEDNNANYHFGMEMEASFTQTADGLDAWGHDIIFEFAGDDDMWFFVDGVLILDLGGVHAAKSGKVNFRTGQVTSSRGNSTLRQLFENSYKAQYPDKTDDEVTEWLNSIFKDGGTVFKDYTPHTMKMIYLERGAGASNLHMRFNLAAIKEGTFILSKKLTGTDNEDNDLIQFPYQIYYRSESDGELHMIGDNGDSDLVKYAGSNNNVTYRPSYAVSGVGVYQHVFLLKPGESAEVTLPEDALNNEYYVVECGVDPDVYDVVKVNSEVPEAVDVAGGRKDYKTTTDTLKNRSTVEYENHVKEGSMRNLTIQKYLYDSDGQERLHYPEDPTLFTFRLYLGNENSNQTNLDTANMYKYFVKDPDGYYCRYDGTQKKFVSLGIREYNGEGQGPYLKDYLESLSPSDRETIIFHTSMYGSISRIPADYKVEVRDLIAKTMWKVEEREYEIPKGYTLRLKDGYQRIDQVPHQNTQTTPIFGVIQAGNDPEIRVSNQKGWGLTVNKEWTDKDFMKSHDDIYFAVYRKEGNTEILLPDRVMQMSHPSTSVYYFFGNLQSGTPFSDYVVREVYVTGDIQVDEEGYVTGYDQVTPIPGGETLTVGATTSGDLHGSYNYKVAYEQGEPTINNENVRTDTVTNSRPGIMLYKKDFYGNNVGGAVFTLKDENGDNVSGTSYTSRAEDGLITIAYLKDGTYTLSETAVPKGYTAIPDDVKITVSTVTGQGGVSTTHVSVSGIDSKYFEVQETPDADMAARITIKNRKSDLKLVKTDASTEEVLEDVHFALYRQVEDSHGVPRKDYNPIAGYEDIVTDENGVLPEITMELNPGTYYLTETRAIDGYDMLDHDVIFTIGADRKVSVAAGAKARLESEEDDHGNLHYTIKVLNGKTRKVSFRKVDIANTDTPLAGAEFDMYKVTGDGDDAVEELIYSGMTSDENGMLALEEIIVFELGSGRYKLVETVAPTGYDAKESPVTVTVADGDGEVDTEDKSTYEVSYDEGTSISGSKDGIVYDPETKTYTMLITDKSGAELTLTGGTGTRWIYLTGALLLIICSIGLISKKRCE